MIAVISKVRRAMTMKAGRQPYSEVTKPTISRPEKPPKIVPDM